MAKQVLIAATCLVALIFGAQGAPTDPCALLSEKPAITIKTVAGNGGGNYSALVKSGAYLELDSDNDATYNGPFYLPLDLQEVEAKHNSREILLTLKHECADVRFVFRRADDEKSHYMTGLEVVLSKPINMQEYYDLHSDQFWADIKSSHYRCNKEKAIRIYGNKKGGGPKMMNFISSEFEYELGGDDELYKNGKFSTEVLHAC